jgi:hypothetical protein
MRFDLGRSGRGLIVAAIAFGASGGAALASDPIDVTIDFAKVMKLSQRADTIFIGNPGIADATMGDEQTLVLTGKTAGTTNLIVLDSSGVEILNSVIRVSSDIRQLRGGDLGRRRSGHVHHRHDTDPGQKRLRDGPVTLKTSLTIVKTRVPENASVKVFRETLCYEPSFP